MKCYHLACHQAMLNMNEQTDEKTIDITKNRLNSVYDGWIEQSSS